MKKSGLLFILILFVIPFISANEYFYNTEIKKGETFLVTIDGNFVDSLLPDNIDFYRGQVKVPLDYDVTKIDDLYYIYALISDQAQSGNYSLRIKEVGYYKGSQIIEDEIRLNFTVLDSFADFSINKGFISTNQDFSFKVQNLQEGRIQLQINEEILSGDTNPLEFSYDNLFNESKSIILKSGEEREIIFDTTSISKTTFRNIIVSSAQTAYTIPVFIFANKTEVITDPSQTSNFKFSPSDLNFTTSTDNKKTDYIYIVNTGKSKLENIKIVLSESLTPYVKLSTYKISKLDSGSEAKVEMYTTSKSESSVEGEITASMTNETIIIPVKISFVKGYVPLPVNDTNSTYGGGGNVTPGGEDTGTSKSSFSLTKIIGWGLLILVILFLAWFYVKKYKKAKKKVDILDIGEKGGLRRDSSGLPPRPTHNLLDLKRR
ncbi:hypothetical protein COU57_04070 [Candidatus Pacearchaeota archaeon CG10_big_fil_rev_8_21_14_0_10_32_14]|nr:MAG: hypothetical protein COU57_04070 [Candidatus Pacearchaeota archaeon CG10_big_fil_rev_8_21_14_0_10_32_14]